MYPPSFRFSSKGLEAMRSGSASPSSGDHEEPPESTSREVAYLREEVSQLRGELQSTQARFGNVLLLFGKILGGNQKGNTNIDLQHSLDSPSKVVEAVETKTSTYAPHDAMHHSIGGAAKDDSSDLEIGHGLNSQRGQDEGNQNAKARSTKDEEEVFARAEEDPGVQAVTREIFRSFNRIRKMEATQRCRCSDVGFIEFEGVASPSTKTGLCLSNRQTAGLLLLNIVITPFLLLVHSVRIYVLPCLQAILLQCCCAAGSILCGKCWRYSDKSFPPNNESLGNFEAGGKGKKIIWRRAHEIVENIPPRNRCDRSAPQLFEDGIEPEDIAQGQLGDCWLLSAIACLSEKPGAIQRLFVERTYNPRGKYTIRLWDGIKRKFVKISIDDQFPCSPLRKGGKKGGKPLFTNPNGGEIWVCLLEKAFAKLSGSYANIEGGHVLWALEAMTGDEVLKYSVDNKTKEWKSYDLVHKLPKERGESEGVRACRFPSTGHSFDEDTMFVVLKKYASSGCIMGAGTRGVDNTRKEGRPGDRNDEKQTGIVPGHAYSILDVRSCFGHRLLKLRNPWGAFEWKGDWSDGSSMWSKHPLVRALIRPESFRKGSDKDDGIFWISWEDFLKYFSSIDVCLTSSGMHDLNLHVYEGASFLGPMIGCIVGCFTYWVCCCGLFKLWCSRPSNKTFIAGVEEKKMKRKRKIKGEKRDRLKKGKN